MQDSSMHINLGFQYSSASIQSKEDVSPFIFPREDDDEGVYVKSFANVTLMVVWITDRVISKQRCQRGGTNRYVCISPMSHALSLVLLR